MSDDDQKLSFGQRVYRALFKVFGPADVGPSGPPTAINPDDRTVPSGHHLVTVTDGKGLRRRIAVPNQTGQSSGPGPDNSIGVYPSSGTGPDTTHDRDASTGPVTSPGPAGPTPGATPSHTPSTTPTPDPTPSPTPTPDSSSGGGGWFGWGSSSGSHDGGGSHGWGGSDGGSSSDGGGGGDSGGGGGGGD